MPMRGPWRNRAGLRIWGETLCAAAKGTGLQKRRDCDKCGEFCVRRETSDSRLAARLGAFTMGAAMQIGFSYASATLVSWQRNAATSDSSSSGATSSGPPGSDGSSSEAAVVSVATSGTRQGHSRHGGDAGGGARGDGHRMQRMAAMLQKLSASLPQDGSAAYAALVVGPNGMRAVAATVGSGGMAVSAVGADLSGVTTGDGNDAVALIGGTVSGIDTGAGSDALAIIALAVSGISTDGADGSGTGNDAVSIVAQAVGDV